MQPHTHPKEARLADVWTPMPGSAYRDRSSARTAALHKTVGLWAAAAVDAVGYVGGLVVVAGVEVDVPARERLGVREVERMMTMRYRAVVCLTVGPMLHIVLVTEAVDTRARRKDSMPAVRERGVEGRLQLSCRPCYAGDLLPAVSRNVLCGTF